jgi:uncharacterized protein with HEPN domain
VKDDRLYLVHISECIQRIELYTVEGRDTFIANTMIQDAVIRNLQTLAESTQRISNSLKAAHSEVEWHRISAFRNVVVHNYMGIELNRVWDIVKQNLPDLKLQVAAILRELEGGSNQ